MLLRHVGLIPDGNRRWCAANGFGHRHLLAQHVATLVRVIATFRSAARVHHAAELGSVRELTMYMMSIDNMTKRGPNDGTHEMVFGMLGAMRLLGTLARARVVARTVTDQPDDEIHLGREWFAQWAASDLPCGVASAVMEAIVATADVDGARDFIGKREWAVRELPPLHCVDRDAEIRCRREEDAEAFRRFLVEMRELSRTVRVRFAGEIHRLPPPAREAVAEIEACFPGCDDHDESFFRVRLALAYDPMEDCRRILLQNENENKNDIDLVIRTGGEKRSSGFFPLETMYSEWVYTDALFPDFGLEDFLAAVRDFQGRQRRFGI